MKAELQRLKVVCYTPKERELRRKYLENYYGWRIKQERRNDQIKQTTAKQAI